MVNLNTDTSKGNILIIDDNPTNLQLLSKILTEEGYNVRCARDSSLVLSGVKAIPPDLILLDIVMPDMSGFDVCRLLKADPQTASIPILFISAFDDIDSKVKAFDVGGVDFITKPFQYQEIIARVKTQITLYNQHNEIELHRLHLESLVDERTKEITQINEKLLWEIYERTRAESELQDLKKYNDMILESAGEGICGLDQNGFIVSINPAGAKMLGWEIQEIIRKPMHEISHHQINHQDQFTNNDCPICDCIQDGLFYRRDDQLFRRKDGSYFPVDFSSTPILDENGSTIGAVVIFQEIIERKRRDRQREATISVAAALRTASTTIELGKALLANLTEYISMTGGAILLYNEAIGEIFIETAIGILEHATGYQFSQNAGLCGQLIQSKKSMIINKYQDDPILSQLLPSDTGLSIACVPIIAQKDTLGLLLTCCSADIIEEDFMILNAIADMTGNTLKRISLYEQTQRRLERLEALRTIDQAILSNTDLRITLHLVLEKIIFLLNVENAIFLLFDQKNNYFEYLDGSGLHLVKKAQKFKPVQDHIAEKVVIEKSTIHFSLKELSKEKWYRHYVQRDNMVDYLGIPLIAKDRIIGVLEVYHTKRMLLDAEEMDFLHTLAGQSAIAIDNVILFESMREANLHLKQSYDATIEGWARALELRDQETEGHTRRVTELTILLSEAIGLDPEKIENIRIGAVLHDVGKMGIPDSILLKPGKLSPDEWEIIKLHTIYGYEMLLPIDFLSPGLDVVYYHHEKWDGTGYPTGKKGKDIPLPARIFCIVDVWDALTSERPYKKAWTIEKALEYIHEQTGKQFDPDIVEAFIKIIHNQRS